METDGSTLPLIQQSDFLHARDKQSRRNTGSKCPRLNENSISAAIKIEFGMVSSFASSCCCYRAGSAGHRLGKGSLRCSVAAAWYLAGLEVSPHRSEHLWNLSWESHPRSPSLLTELKLCRLTAGCASPISESLAGLVSVVREMQVFWLFWVKSGDNRFALLLPYWEWGSLCPWRFWEMAHGAGFFCPPCGIYRRRLVSDKWRAFSKSNLVLTVYSPYPGEHEKHFKNSSDKWVINQRLALH